MIVDCSMIHEKNMGDFDSNNFQWKINSPILQYPMSWSAAFKLCFSPPVESMVTIGTISTGPMYTCVLNVDY